MYGYENAASGLKKMFTAQVGSIICVVLMMIPFIGVIGLIGVFVFAVMSLIIYGQMVAQSIAQEKTSKAAKQPLHLPLCRWS